MMSPLTSQTCARYWLLFVCRQSLVKESLTVSSATFSTGNIFAIIFLTHSPDALEIKRKNLGLCLNFLLELAFNETECLHSLLPVSQDCVITPKEEERGRVGSLHLSE